MTIAVLPRPATYATRVSTIEPLIGIVLTIAIPLCFYFQTPPAVKVLAGVVAGIYLCLLALTMVRPPEIIAFTCEPASDGPDIFRFTSSTKGALGSVTFYHWDGRPKPLQTGFDVVTSALDPGNQVRLVARSRWLPIIAREATIRRPALGARA